jgi:2-keto-3-deoxy-L-rhamnonate aldolase RhmA
MGEMKVRNAARERLEKGEMSLGVGIRTARTVDIAKMMKTAGYDWLFIDLEHGPMSIDFATTLAVAALDTGISPIVRVPFMQHSMATRVLDNGALGIVMPHVDTPEQAREIVDHLKYPPIGHRSLAGSQAIFDFKRIPIAEMIEAANAALLVIARWRPQQQSPMPKRSLQSRASTHC